MAGTTSTSSRPRKSMAQRPRQPLSHPFASLAGLFAVWKAFLFAVAFACPDDGYDSSTQLFFRQSALDHQRHRDHGGAAPAGFLLTAARHAVSRLVRWDAIYIVSAASKGYTYEQEWAFSWGFTRFVGMTSQLCEFPHGYL
jgi:phosphatidylinositol glycan class V